MQVGLGFGVAVRLGEADVGWGAAEVGEGPAGWVVVEAGVDGWAVGPGVVDGLGVAELADAEAEELALVVPDRCGVGFP